MAEVTSFQELNELRNEDLLERYIALWSRFQFSSTVADKILLYMNRHWTNREADRTTSTTQTYAAYDVSISLNLTKIDYLTSAGRLNLENGAF